MTPDQIAWVRHKSRPTAEAVVRNLHSARGMPYALGPLTTERGGTYILCGAGPSLTAALPHLAGMQERGAIICTVNTALPAVAAVVEPDVVLTRETVDVSSHLAHRAKLRVLDLAASPKVWAAAMAQGPCAWFVQGSNQFAEVSNALGVRPLFGGTAAMTALVALVAEWGASHIVLAGCDLALAADGVGYAPGTAFGGYAVASDGTVAGEGQDRKREQHAAAGIALPPSLETLIEVPGWGGRPVRTLATHKDQIEWIGQFARTFRGVVVDTSGGAAKDHVQRWPASISSLPVHTMSMFDDDDGIGAGHVNVDAAIADIRRQAELARTIALNVTDLSGNVVGIPAGLRGCDIVELAAAAEMLAVTESQAPLSMKVRRAYEAMDSAGRAVEEWVGPPADTATTPEPVPSAA